jgi:peroxiredoxin
MARRSGDSPNWRLWRIAAAAAALCGLASVASCSSSSQPVKLDPHKPREDAYGVKDYREIKFHDDAATNAPLDEQLSDLAFTDLRGNTVSPKDYIGKKNVVLVVTRGSARYICVYCSTQTSRLVAQYDEFARRDAEVLVVFPLNSGGDRELADHFVKFVRDKLPPPPPDLPFPLLLDVELKAVDKLGLRQKLAKPATYILDKTGQVRFAYVGQTQADRPSVKAILAQLDEVNSEAQPPRGDAALPAGEGKSR